MRDPFPIAPPAWLMSAVKPYADALNLYSLPLHTHEIIFAVAAYSFIYSYISPPLSRKLCPQIYARLSHRTRVNWDVHVVSFFQSVLISVLSLWVIWYDEERKAWRASGQYPMRIWAYHGSGGLLQSFALGYFLWDLYMCTAHVAIFGWGMLAHAISAVSVFALGYRPFVYYSAPVFLLYELSSPFLNIHWFCDKLNLTGSIYQAVNGAFLTLTFFSCRIVWGLYSSALVFRDMYSALQLNAMLPSKTPSPFTVARLQEIYTDTDGQTFAFNSHRHLPLWLPLAYLASNLVLNTLNIFWFGKMISTIRARFNPPLGTKGTSDVPYRSYDGSTSHEDEAAHVKAAAEKATEQVGDAAETALSSANGDGAKGSIAKRSRRMA